MITINNTIATSATWLVKEMKGISGGTKITLEIRRYNDGLKWQPVEATEANVGSPLTHA